MDDINPQQLQELSDSLYELTGAVRAYSQQTKDSSVPQAEGAQKVRRAWKHAVKVQQKATQQQQRKLAEEETLEDKQKKIYEDELRYRGYKLDATGKEVKTRVELTDLQRRELQELDKRIAKERELAEVAKDPVKAFRDMSQSVNSVQGIFGQFQERLFELTGRSQALAAGIVVASAAISGVTKAALSMADSLYQGERGAKVGAKALKELSSEITKAAYGIGAALMFLPGLGLVSKAVGAAIALFGVAMEGSTKLAEMGAEYNDKVYDSFGKLSEAGLTTAQGMSGVSSTIEKLSVTSAEIEKFNGLVTTNSKDLAMFGGTASGGLEKFAEVAGKIVNPLSETNKKLLLLGIQSDQQREHTLKYMATQTRMGMLQNKTQADQIKGAVAYIEELDRIAAITGIGRKEQEEAQKQVLAIEELRAAMYQAERAGDTKRQQELEQAFKYSSRLMAEGRKKEAAGVAKFYAAGKNVIDAESAAAAQSSRGAIEAITAGKQGEDVYQAGIESAKEQARLVAGTKAIGGDVSDRVADFNSTLDAIKRNEKLAQEAKDLGYTSIEAYTKFLQSQKTEAPDPTLAKNVEAAQTQQKAALILDQAAKAMDGAALAMASSVKAFNEAVELFARASGYKQPEKPKDLATARETDKDALKKQQQALDQAKKVMSDPKATPEQREAAKKAEEAANKESQIAMAQRREAEMKLREEWRKEMKTLRAQGKGDQVVGLDEYLKKKLAEQEKTKAPQSSGGTPAAAAPTSAKEEAPTTAPPTSGGAPEPAPNTNQESSVKAKPTVKEQTPPTRAAEPARPVSKTETNTTLLIANEPVHPDKPLSARQLAVIELGISMGNTYPNEILKKFQNQVSAKPVEAEKKDEEIPIDVNKALVGGIFKGPNASSIMPSKSTMTANEILQSIKDSTNKVERKTVESELPGLEEVAEGNIQKSNTISQQKTNSSKLLENLASIMESKFDDIIGAISENNNIKEEILLYSQN